MDFQTFRTRVERDQAIADYIDDLTQQASGVDDRSVGLDVLFGIIAYALYRRVKNHYDYQRGLRDADLRHGLEAEVQALVEHGWKQDAALKAVVRIDETVTKLPPEDPIVRAGLALLTRVR